MAATAIGLDIGGTNIRAARVAPDGQIEARAAGPSARDPEEVLARCLALVADVRAPGVTALGIGVPGQVHRATRAVLSGGFVDLSRIPFADRMEAATGLPVTLENDATMALLGEAACGAARGCGNVVMLTIGTGIGGAMLEQGEVVRGRGAAGQLGHLTVEPEGRPCVCGRRGCVETVSSGTAFGQHLAEAGLPPGTRVADLLGSDDPRAAGVLTAWGRPLRHAIDTLIAAFNPDLVLLGGGAGAAAVQVVGRFPAAESWFDAPVVAASLGDDAGVVGAALAALRARPRAKRAVLVNGVPASGKSGIARALSDATGWPVLTLDTIKNPFLQELGPVDREGNRTLGRASYAAIFGLMRDAPAGSTFIIDAWFGFRPPEVLEAGLAHAGIERTAEVWCSAPPDVVGARYGARVGDRPQGHPGAEYVPELIALAGRASPLRRGPLREEDTTRPLDLPALLAWVRDALAEDNR
jgi:glucokinase